MQTLYYFVATVLIVGGLVWKLSAKLTQLEDGLDTIKNNDLHHLKEDIDWLKDSIKLLLSDRG